MEIESYRNLIVWQKSMQLVVEIYSITAKYPKAEVFGLVSQSRRCSASIPSNIAEGRTRGSRKDFRQFLIIAMSSGAELETQLEIAKQLKFIASTDTNIPDGLLTEVMKMLNSMIKKLA